MPLEECDYGYDYPIKAVRFGDMYLDVRKMREDEMIKNGKTYYCEVNGIIYEEGEEDFEILTNPNASLEDIDKK